MDVLNPALRRIRRLTTRKNKPTRQRPPESSRRKPPNAPTLRHGSAVLRPTSQREGSKAAKVLGLLRRPDGASLKELMRATGWLAHSVRGYLSGTVSKRMGLKLVSAKSKDGERRYSVQG